MTTEAERTIAMARLVNDAENSAYAAELELELASAEAEVLQLREVVERDTLAGRLMGGVWVWEIAGSRN